MSDPLHGAEICHCGATHPRQRLVLTGGPGAGKTAVLELLRRTFCEHVVTLPESAGIVFGGGFPRSTEPAAHRCAQRAIFHVQRQLERFADDSLSSAVTVCDRGTVDGAAYWPPGGTESLFASVGSSLAEEMSHYDAVIHLRTPSADGGYNRSNPLRHESALEARAIDERILALWAAHPHRIVIENTYDFVAKAEKAIAAIRALVPECCRPSQSAVLTLEGTPP